MPDADLDTEVKRLLNAKRGDWPRVCQRADVSHSWISKFVRGGIPNPGYATLKKLHDVLTSPDSGTTVPEPATNGD